MPALWMNVCASRVSVRSVARDKAHNVFIQWRLASETNIHGLV